MFSSYPATFQQRQFLWLQNLDANSSAYTIPLVFTIDGNLDVAALTQTYTDVFYRNSAFNIVFTVENGSHCIKESSCPVEGLFPILEMTDDSTSDVLNEICLFIGKPFDLKTGPLYRSLLIKRSMNSYIWVLALQHSICDLRTKELLCEAIGKRYNEFGKGASNSGTEMAIVTDYKSYAHGQTQWVMTEAAKKMEKFWKETLDGFPDLLSLPLDFQRPSYLKLDGTIVPISFNEDISLKIRRFSKKYEVTPFLCLFTAYAVLLSRYSNQEKFIVGMPFTNRRESTFKDTYGCFVNMLPIPIDLSDNRSIAECMKAIRKTMLFAHRNQEFPTELIINNLEGVGKNLDKNPLYQAGFTFEPLCTLVLNECNVQQRYVHHGGSQLDLFATFWTEDDLFQGCFEYNESLFTHDTVARWADNFQYLVEYFIGHPDQPVQSIPIMCDEEIERLKGFSKSTVLLSDSYLSFMELFSKNVEMYQYKVAVVFNNREITYKNLGDMTDCVSQYLLCNNVKQGQVIGILMDRSEMMLASMVGILKSGAAYLPLDPDFPIDRNRFIIDDSQVQLIITEEKYRSLLSDCGCKTVLMSDVGSGCLQNVAAVDAGSEETAAYMIYTSGSTGKPKGVIITHGNLDNFVQSMLCEPGITETDVMLAVTTISFDIHVLELLVPLAAGATIIIAPKEIQSDASALSNQIINQNVTIMQATPVTWKLLCASGWSGKQDSFTILCGGEAMSVELSRLLFQRCSKLYNMYGPTETTVWSTCYRVTGKESNIPIGKPIANTDVVIVNRWGNRAPVGVWGELFIGGAGVSKGYHNRVQLTDDQFPIVALKSDVMCRYYKTGDICRFNNDGLLECAGRKDNQIKLRGYRIELEEIEQTIETWPGISSAAVVVHGNYEAEMLVAFIVMSGQSLLKKESIRNYMFSKLPAYMIPTRFIQLPSLPMTPNRKVDRNTLKIREISQSDNAVNVIVKSYGPIERKLVEIWTGILHLDIGSVETSFFDVGGNSLLLLKLRDALIEEMSFDIPVTTLLQYPTIKTLADYMKQGQVQKSEFAKTRSALQKKALRKFGKR